MYLNLLLIIVIILLLLYFIYKKKEHYKNVAYKFVSEQDLENVVTELINITQFYIMTINLYKEIKFKMFKLIRDSLLRININENDYNKNLTLGFYIYLDNESEGTYNNVLKIKNNEDEVYFELSFIEKDIYIKFPKDNTQQSILFKNEVDFTFENTNFIIIQIDNDNNIIEVNINNIKKEIKQFNKLINYSSKQIEFGPNFEGDIGNILIFHKKINDETICSNYICNEYSTQNNTCDFKLETADTQLMDQSINPLNKCIETCYQQNCDIELCQKICIDCQDLNTENWPLEKKKELCPWYEDNKLLDRGKPDAPKIRGFSIENESILLEWKKPYDGNINITHYIIEINNTINNDTRLVWLDKESDCKICEYEIKGLESEVYYNISVRAVNSEKQGGGIGNKSNIITLSPKGKNSKFLKNVLSEFNYSEINQINNLKNSQNYNCENRIKTNSDHILDTLNINDIDIYKYVKENN